MVRITSGTAKGRNIKTPDVSEFRAVQDKAKLAIFSILGDRIIDANCLDLYAGSGNLGLEALSRGAGHCVFVDEGYPSEMAIRENLVDLGFEDKADVIKSDVIKYVVNAMEKYDIIFADPFYKDKHFRFLFENMEEVLTDNGVIIFSHSNDTDIDDAMKNTKNLEIYDTKKYGNAHITILRKNG